MSDKFYITTSIAYTNSPPHVGFALELLQADVLARYHRQLNDDTFYLTGTDEHGNTIVKGAAKYGKKVTEFVDEISEKFKKLTEILNISNNDFIRTTDQKRHWPSVFKLWQKISEKGDLYQKEYTGLYCVGHEAFLKKSELIDGFCPLHKTEPEKISEKNWFFRLTNYKEKVKELIEQDEIKILPETRKNEMLQLIDEAEDVSFSRPMESLSWGIPVPNDPDQRIYVWAEALMNYVSALNYADDGGGFKKYWPAEVHLIGKDILRFHALIWPAILLSADLELPKSVFVHGFVTANGQKMSKTIGNVVDPFKIVEKYGVDPVRYFLLREIPSGEDGDFSVEKLEGRYQADLANGLGNLVQRVLTLIENNLLGEIDYLKRYEDGEIVKRISDAEKIYHEKIKEFKLHEALGAVFGLVDLANVYINEHRPWQLAGENPEHFLEVMINTVRLVLTITVLLYPFLPETSEKILASFGTSQEQLSGEWDQTKFIIKKGKPLFPRL